MPAGTPQFLLAVFARSAENILFQMGDAPVIPDAILAIGELSLLPTQTATR
jgi:hypothetical protein